MCVLFLHTLTQNVSFDFTLPTAGYAQTEHKRKCEDLGLQLSSVRQDVLEKELQLVALQEAHTELQLIHTQTLTSKALLEDQLHNMSLERAAISKELDKTQQQLRKSFKEHRSSRISFAMLFLLFFTVAAASRSASDADVHDLLTPF